MSEWSCLTPAAQAEIFAKGNRLNVVGLHGEYRKETELVPASTTGTTALPVPWCKRYGVPLRSSPDPLELLCCIGGGGGPPVGEGRKKPVKDRASGASFTWLLPKILRQRYQSVLAGADCRPTSTSPLAIEMNGTGKLSTSFLLSLSFGSASAVEANLASVCFEVLSLRQNPINMSMDMQISCRTEIHLEVVLVRVDSQARPWTCCFSARTARARGTLAKCTEAMEPFRAPSRLPKNHPCCSAGTGTTFKGPVALLDLGPQDVQSQDGVDKVPQNSPRFARSGMDHGLLGSNTDASP